MNNLTLGFWTGLFHNYYYKILWEKDDLIKEICPYLTNKERDLKSIFESLDSIRNFRNKVFHFNSIQNINLDELDKTLNKITFEISGLNINNIELR